MYLVKSNQEGNNSFIWGRLIYTEDTHLHILLITILTSPKDYHTEISKIKIWPNIAMISDPIMVTNLTNHDKCVIKCR